MAITMPEEPKEQFTKIVVDLPDAEDGVGGEGLWTVALGDDLYEVRNSPWHSREINYRDVVRAIAPDETKNPVFASVEKRSGHRTIQVILFKEAQPRKDEILSELKKLGATFENANGSLFALDFAPGVDWGPALEYLRTLLDQDLADHRTSAY
jgi:Domain of unknown function (DUF4265)